MKFTKHIVPFLKEHKYQYILGIVLLLLVDGLQLLTPIVLGNFTDALTSGEILQGDLAFFALAVIGIAVGVALGRYGWRMLIIRTSKKLEYWLRNRLFTHLETLDQNYYNHHKTGDLMAHATNDINAIRMGFGPGIIMAIDAIFITIMSVTIMLTNINVELTLLALLPFPLIAILATLLGKVIQRRFKGVQEAFSKLTENVNETFSGIRVIKSFVQERLELVNFNKVNKLNFTANLKLTMIFGTLFPLVGLISFFSLLIAILLGGNLVIAGTITIGKFVTFISYIGMLAWPMMAFGFVFNVMQRSKVSLERINVILETKGDITDPEHPVHTQYIKPAIKVKNLSFTYPGFEELALNNITFNVNEGETLAIVGRTGSGKTTLVNLLMKQYNVEDDSIIFGEYDINSLPVKQLRSHIGYVPQDNFLFSKPISDNIAFANAMLNEDSIRNAADVAGIIKEIESFNEGFDTELGERGVNLSGGQKQRISIARAFANNPDILILDDSLSAVDTKTEDRILGHLREELKEKTAIIIAHRISTIKDADRIIVLDEGKLAEQGTHASLIEEKGIYEDMYRRQLLEEKIREE